jgi:hypothetical protein
MAPRLDRFAHYIASLGQGLATPVALFMQLFWALYCISIGRQSRRREFRADTLGGEITSPTDMERALIKVCSYCDYCGSTESSVIKQDRVNPELQLQQRLANGYPAFLQAFTADEKAASSEMPHPVDTHPPLNARLENLGIHPSAALADPDLHQPVTTSWCDTIPAAREIEDRLWAERENFLQDVHAEELAWRLLPSGEEEEAWVTARFPELVFTKADGSAITINYRGIQVPGYADLIGFETLGEMTLADTVTLKKQLTLAHRPVSATKGIKTICIPTEFKGDGLVLDVLNRYYARHQHSRVVNKAD